MISLRDCLRKLGMVRSILNSSYAYAIPPEGLGPVELQQFRMRGLLPDFLDVELLLNRDGSFATKWNGARRRAVAGLIADLRIALVEAGELRVPHEASHRANLELATRMLDEVTNGLML